MLAQWAQQKKRPSASTPWPMTLMPQYSQVGARACTAHSKLSNVCDFGKKLQEAGIVPSIGKAGSALDNAISESFVSTLKCDLVHGRRFPTREAAKSAVFEYLEAFYNRRRLHSRPWQARSC
jgi:hypothetical protein